MNKNYQLLNEHLYIEVVDEINNISKIQKYTEINNDLLMFSANIGHPGLHSVVGYFDDGKLRKRSNKIHLTFHDQNIEKKNIYLDENFLHTIAISNNGIYAKYYDVDNIINDINTIAIFSTQKITKDILSYQYYLFLQYISLHKNFIIRHKKNGPIIIVNSS